MIRVSVATALKLTAVGACTATLLSACGGPAAIDPAATASTVDDFVFQHTGFRPTDVRCPPGIPATAGGRFDCHFTGLEGPYTAYLRIVNVHGRRVFYRMDTRPSNWQPPTLR
jgi:hypothetical protein